jgi:hypothetical protein
MKTRKNPAGIPESLLDIARMIVTVALVTVFLFFLRTMC